MRLDRLASLVRSKNAGPFQLTFDILFSDPAVYERVKASKVLNAELIAHLYDCDIDSVRFFECDNALAFKATIPRRHVQGSFGDPDLHGGQQHAPLMAVDITT
ncbi:MAG TPA: DUF4387 domain-containing protein [Candidatus Dormibacteraeota bacterium]|nr:DUF4387 domain-containing protein [Candidatus Dormibacteraeota bacterium]